MNGSVIEMKMMSPPCIRCSRIGFIRNPRILSETNQQTPSAATYTIAIRNSLDRSSSRCSRKVMPRSVFGVVSCIGGRSRSLGRGLRGGRGGSRRRRRGTRRSARGVELAQPLQERAPGERRRRADGGRDRLRRVLDLLELDLALEARAEVLRRLPELRRRLAEHPPDLGELARPEQQQGQSEDEDELGAAYGAEHARRLSDAGRSVKERPADPAFHCRSRA